MSTVGAITLQDKYLQEEGRIYITGVQALVRLPLVQRRRDQAAGLDTAGFISGYRGSPLGAYDRELWAAHRHLQAARVHFEPGLNEELAATSVWGTQQLGLLPGARYAGVFGIWYAKSPGVDRSGDALKHANAAGTSPLGGVLAVTGDDHACKSASLPSQSEFALLDASIPVLHPATVAEVLRFGLIGIEMSRRTGLWIGMKALADTMDSAGTVSIEEAEPRVIVPDRLAGDLSIRWPDSPLEQEHRLFERKLPAAIEFGRENGLNRVLVDAPSARMVIIAVGKSAPDVRHALERLGLGARELRNLGVRLLGIGMPWPLDARLIRDTCADVEEVFVVEEKRPLVEDQVARALLFMSDVARPRLLGKLDEHGAPLLAAAGAFDVDGLAQLIGKRILRLVGSGSDELRQRVTRIEAELADSKKEAALARRLPYFCSGCPHNRSTRVPAGSHALAGIGCHFMAQWMDRDTVTFTQMGGEGATWIGQAPFTDTRHVFVNLGDGTYAHSGILAIRAAIAARMTMTYKLLYNDAVAMTGGQAAEGGFTVAQLVAQLRAEGVAAIRIVSENPRRFAAEALPAEVRVHAREELEIVQRELRETSGVTVLIFDQVCAAEKRRRRKRGLMPDAPRRVTINEAVCEGCGDCGIQSNCVSIVPVETAFGRKRRIDQTSCNRDMTCLEGFCPSFVSIEGATPRRQTISVGRTPEIPAPAVTARSETNLVVAGIGGTGIVTIGAILGMAAHIEGKAVSVMDHIGLSQKGGEVTTHIRIAGSPQALGPVRLARGEAATLIACDLVVGASPEVLRLLARSSLAVVNEHETMTGEFTRSPDLEYPAAAMRGRIERCARTVCADLNAIALRLLGDTVGVNVMALGMAWQLGRIPLAEESIHRAIELNGVAIELNKAAFRWGRVLAHDPSMLPALQSTSARAPETLGELIELHERHMKAYQGPELAERYRQLIERTLELEQRIVPGATRLTATVARSYHKLLACKDEYEVARLHVAPEFLASVRDEFSGGRLTFHLAPPLLSRRDAVSGRPRKLRFGPWIIPIFRLLAAMRRLRGTALDPFGYTAERRAERQRIVDFERLMERVSRELTSMNYGQAVRIAAVAQSIRGFGPVRDASARRAEAHLAELLRHWPEGDGGEAASAAGKMDERTV